MRKLLCSIFIITIALLLFGCQESQSKEKVTDPKQTGEQNNNETKNEGNDMKQKDIFDFKHIHQAPEATKDQSLDKVIKVFFDESTLDKPYEAVAIDIDKNEIYKNPIISRRGLRAQDGIVPIDDAEKVLDILEKYDVQTWKENNTSEKEEEAYEDGYSWKLSLQYEDGTVEKYEGHDEAEVPAQFNQLAEALRSFAAERTEEN